MCFFRFVKKRKLTKDTNTLRILRREKKTIEKSKFTMIVAVFFSPFMPHKNKKKDDVGLFIEPLEHEELEQTV